MLHYATTVSELKGHVKMRIIMDGTPILIIFLGDEVYAIQDHCTHLGASLSKGTLDGKQIKCRSHGAVFDVMTGDVIEKPHLGPLKMPAKKAKTFPVLIKEGNVYIEI
jgi:3-phenylpropionate/trans-cinnamate dioxygenase ferredoxin component